MSPLFKGKKNYKRNIKELQSSKPSPRRAKAIRTYAKNHGVTMKQAKAMMSVIIAKSKAGMSIKKKK